MLWQRDSNPEHPQAQASLFCALDHSATLPTYFEMRKKEYLFAIPHFPFRSSDRSIDCVLANIHTYISPPRRHYIHKS